MVIRRLPQYALDLPCARDSLRSSRHDLHETLGWIHQDLAIRADTAVDAQPHGHLDRPPGGHGEVDSRASVYLSNLENRFDGGIGDVQGIANDWRRV